MLVPKLKIEDVRCSFDVEGDFPLTVLDGIDFSVNENEFIAVIGPSGSGKSTLFNVISGLLTPDSGRVLLDGTDVTGTPGCLAYMMQKDLLLPWRTILDNVTLGPEIAGKPRSEVQADARKLLQRFGLDGFESFYPAALSGGMRQRAALMRTILCDRQVLLLDEPFGALDALTRSSLQEWLLNIWHDFKRTVVLITHDPDEAVFLADRVIVTTSRPMCIKGLVAVPLGRPRRRDVTTSVEFARIKGEVLDLVTSDGSKMAAAGTIRTGADRGSSSEALLS